MHTSSLSIVGTGIRIGQLAAEARACLEQADKVLYLLTDPISYTWLIALRPDAESLHTSYQAGKDRAGSYLEMVERTLAYLRQGLDTCVAAYGHPGVFAFPMHEAI